MFPVSPTDILQVSSISFLQFANTISTPKALYRVGGLLFLYILIINFLLPSEPEK